MLNYREEYFLGKGIREGFNTCLDRIEVALKSTSNIDEVQEVINQLRSEVKDCGRMDR